MAKAVLRFGCKESRGANISSDSGCFRLMLSKIVSESIFSGTTG